MRISFSRPQLQWKFNAKTDRLAVVSPRCSGVQNEGVVFDIKKYVDVTERNIVELNRSRLKALEDANCERVLRLATERKVTSLKERLEEMEDKVNALKKKLNVNEAEPIPKNGYEFEESDSGTETEEEEEEEEEEITEEITEELLPEELLPEDPVDEIILHYRTSWKTAYIHFKLDSNEWTKSPGLEMESREKEKYIKLEGTCVEFVLNNGRHDWDKPYGKHGNSPKNYRINSPGAYSLNNGLIQKLE